MPPRTTTWLAALLALTSATIAQSTQSFNLTLTFSPSTNDTTTSEDAPCAGRDNQDSIIFSTYFLPVPGAGGCVNLAEAFAGNTSHVAASYSYANNAGRDVTANISFATQNHEAFDPSANYSQVIYRQESAGEQSQAGDERYFAEREVYFYFGEDCRQVSDGEGGLLPWYYESTCRSAGDCERFPYAVKSFRIYRADVYDTKVQKMRDKKNKCVLGAYLGAAGTVRPPWALALAGMGVMGVMLAV